MTGIIYPIHKCFNDLIFNRVKTFEFRTRIPKNLTTGTKIYIYETAKQGGCKMVVGEFTVGNIIDTNYRLGACPFLPYFYRNIVKDEDYAQKFEKALSLSMPNYVKGTAVNFALDDKSIAYIEQTGEYPPYHIQTPGGYDKTGKAMSACDDWLKKIGFYNDCEESYYNFAYEILNPVRYATPKNLNEFTKLDGTPVKKAPQSFVYVKEV